MFHLFLLSLPLSVTCFRQFSCISCTESGRTTRKSFWIFGSFSPCLWAFIRIFHVLMFSVTCALHINANCLTIILAWRVSVGERYGSFAICRSDVVGSGVKIWLILTNDYVRFFTGIVSEIFTYFVTKR